MTGGSAPVPGPVVLSDLSSLPGLPERASVYWRPRVDDAALRRVGRLWTLSIVAHTVPFVVAAVLLVLLKPLTAPVALVLLAHAWLIPELYAARGAGVLRPRSPAGAPAEQRALLLLGDLIDDPGRRSARPHRTRAAAGRTGRVDPGGGGCGARAPRGTTGQLLLREGDRIGSPGGRPDRSPAARAALRRARLCHRGKPRLFRGVLAAAQTAPVRASRGSADGSGDLPASARACGRVATGQARTLGDLHSGRGGRVGTYTGIPARRASPAWASSSVCSTRPVAAAVAMISRSVALLVRFCARAAARMSP